METPSRGARRAQHALHGSQARSIHIAMAGRMRFIVKKLSITRESNTYHARKSKRMWDGRARNCWRGDDGRRARELAPGMSLISVGAWYRELIFTGCTSPRSHMYAPRTYVRHNFVRDNVSVGRPANEGDEFRSSTPPDCFMHKCATFWIYRLV